MRDEGVGVRLIQDLARERQRYPEVEFRDLGTGGLGLVHALDKRRAAIIIDCARMGKAPGEFERFTPERVRSIKQISGTSLHEGDLLRTLDIAQALGQCPEHLVIFGIEPADTSPGLELTPLIAARIPLYRNAVLCEVRTLAGLVLPGTTRVGPLFSS
ncbi:MAG: hydrogenase maturation protease [Kiritimatiellaeota bacterium]|nr:hydrogenase maturation protease [Kiritimatiellota bacterium]